jgi:hypothetical protein
MMITDDEISIFTLKTIAQARLQPTASELRPDPEIRAALAAAFGGIEPAPASESDLARAALDLLRQDAAYAEPIQVMASQASEPASRQRYIEPVTITLAAAALLVLQTRVKFKLDSNHQWSIEVDKKSSSDAAVKLLVQRLLPFLGK